MFSKLRPTLIYRNLSPEIANHDQDIDADEWDYNGRIVYRGLCDPNYENEGLSVYWLYDADLKRVGLSEHEKNNEEKFEPLWFLDNEFSTLFQESWTSVDKTLWTLLSSEAYQDCLEDDFTTVIDRTLSSNSRLVTPEFIQLLPEVYNCERCGKQSILGMKNCSTVKKTYLNFTNSILFINSNYVLYVPPVDSSVWSKLKLQPPSYDEKLSSPVEPALQPELVEQPEALLEQEHLVQLHLHPDLPHQELHP
jgi:hypothetical protein